MNRDRLEVWNTKGLLATADTSFAPDTGDMLNIRKTVWIVASRYFVIDDADDAVTRRGVCVVRVAPWQPKPKAKGAKKQHVRTTRRPDGTHERVVLTPVSSGSLDRGKVERAVSKLRGKRKEAKPR